MAKPRDKCGVFAVLRNGCSQEHELAQTIYVGLLALQHRGHESAGISVFDGRSILTHRAMETIDIVFGPQIDLRLYRNFIRANSGESGEELEALDQNFLRANRETPLVKLAGIAGIGHTRYSTTGGSIQENIHPIPFYFRNQDAAIAHNGNLTNVDELKQILDSRGGY